MAFTTIGRGSMVEWSFGILLAIRKRAEESRTYDCIMRDVLFL